jgi:hypothetical protein
VGTTWGALEVDEAGDEGATNGRAVGPLASVPWAVKLLGALGAGDGGGAVGPLRPGV